MTRHLSGVIYLEDQLITAIDPNKLNVNSSFVWNINAKHQLAGHALEAALWSLGAYDLQTLT